MLHVFVCDSENYMDKLVGKDLLGKSHVSYTKECDRNEFRNNCHLACTPDLSFSWNPVGLVQTHFGPPAGNGDENGRKVDFGITWKMGDARGSAAVYDPNPWHPFLERHRAGEGTLPRKCSRSVHESIPCVAKLLQTDLKDFRSVYGVTDTDFNYYGTNYGVIDTDLAFLVP